jgi:tricorn protease
MGLEQRMVILPVPAGNYSTLGAAKGKIIYLKYPAAGTTGGQGAIRFFDIEKREEKTVLEDVNDYVLSENRGGSWQCGPIIPLPS